MGRRVADDDKALFRAAVANTRPLEQRARAKRPAPPAAIPAQSRAEQQAVLRESLAPASEELALTASEGFSYCRPGVQRGVLRKLARGQIRVDAELDLHGLIASAAKHAVSNFLEQARQRPGAQTPARGATAPACRGAGLLQRPAGGWWQRGGSGVVATATLVAS